MCCLESLALLPNEPILIISPLPAFRLKRLMPWRTVGQASTACAEGCCGRALKLVKTISWMDLRMFWSISLRPTCHVLRGDSPLAVNLPRQPRILFRLPMLRFPFHPAPY